jgi:hypothetical protein
MHIPFYGAVRGVTGSMHMITSEKDQKELSLKPSPLYLTRVAAPNVAEVYRPY